MNDPVLTHQLKAIDNACRRLQALTASDAKVSGVLLCMRSLLVRLLLDHSIKARLDADARVRLHELTQDVAAVLGEPPLWAASDDAPVLPALSDAVLRLQAVDTAPAEQLIQRLLAIEVQNLRDFEAAYRAASAAGEESSAQAQAPYSNATLGAYLSGLSAEVFAGDQLTVESIEVISGGYSKLTLRARLHAAGDCPKTVILRVDRPENQKFVGTRVIDEYPLLIALYEAGVRVPRPYAFEASGAVVGAPAIVLGEVAGKTVGDLFDFPPPNRELGMQLARQLALIHAMPESIAVKSEAASSEDMVGALRHEVEGFRAGWKALRKPSAIVEAAFRCVDSNMHLAAGRRAFIHGDFGLHNVLVDQGRITAVLDWEFARLGNPAVDLGWFYYTAEHLVGWDRFLSDYADAGGIVPPIAQVDFYRLWGALRFAILCCQVDAGFNAGALAEIDYAVPGNRLLRTQLLRVAKALEPFGAGSSAA